MKHIPNEIINIIFSYIERPSSYKIMKYVVEDCYEEDYDPYTALYWYHNFCYKYSFSEWYFLYRKHMNCKNCTPSKILVGHDRL
jgi:hypothetical protein